MISVKDISISNYEVDGKSGVTLAFDKMNSVNKGDFVYISVFDEEIELNSISDSSVELWLDWIVSNFNIKSSTSTAIRKDKSIEILNNGSEEHKLEIDTGSE